MISIFIIGKSIMAEENRDIIHMTLKDGKVVIETRPDLAPKHVAQIKQLINEGQYDGVVFHRVIDGFMAQTGDVEFGNSSNDKFNMSRAGTGGSNLPDIPAEFSDANHGRGAVSMARAQNPDSANSQFFIVFNDASFLDGQYTVWAQVIEGMELVDNITRGEPPQDPDKIIKMEIIKE
ncbi:MAG: Peptidyl-prolyl cis-trans isomerase B [Alphaproteobacteria bacterium MarineAlpha5_Bin6]|nr:MAG: Peptidyl-prolyl cis-trans isomerase B [Alphaproteobacteria bacterium MarineAlpha5_Bin6]|tara:strand:+ start:5552 stop:6085 length:534 start_codon:yes stop_codon:yes gene_type:complete